MIVLIHCVFYMQVKRNKRNVMQCCDEDIMIVLIHCVFHMQVKRNKRNG